uniref:Insulin-like androgenic gland hormone 1 n=1 Tax=Lysmata vittata TaxID=749979 RepID=A0A7L7YY90_9EUCA|nr:insulin-like androgenic gland hormone 1 [Lysmata vittata]
MEPGHLSALLLLLSCSVLLILLPHSTCGYEIKCLAHDFDCGNLSGTLSLTCKTYYDYYRERRSVDLDLSSLENSHSHNAGGIPIKIFGEMSREDANQVLKSRGGRYRRSYVTAYDECCKRVDDGGPHCTYNEVVGYCEELHAGVNTCNRSPGH